MELKTCSKCKEDKPFSEFRKRGGLQNHLYKSRCKKCLYNDHKDWVESNPDRIRSYRDKDSWTLAKRCRRRNISPEELVDKYEQQNCKCDICKKEIDLMDSAIDHNHKTGDFRGVLCKKCNRALGMFGDSITILNNAMSYLINNGSYGE
jgi:hypothetical protein